MPTLLEPVNPRTLGPLFLGEKWRSVTVRFVARSWISTSLNSAITAENSSVSMSLGKRWPAQNRIPAILGIIIVKSAWMISFFAKVVVNIRRDEAAFRSKTICAKNVKKNFKFEARNPCLRQAGEIRNKHE
jgi:hypothetical protein